MEVMFVIVKDIYSLSWFWGGKRGHPPQKHKPVEINYFKVFVHCQLQCLLLQASCGVWSFEQSLSEVTSHKPLISRIFVILAHSDKLSTKKSSTLSRIKRKHDKAYTAFPLFLMHQPQSFPFPLVKEGWKSHQGDAFIHFRKVVESGWKMRWKMN